MDAVTWLQTYIDSSNLAAELTIIAAKKNLQYSQDRERLVVENNKKALLMNLSTGWIWIVDKKTNKTITDMHYLDALAQSAFRYNKAAKYLISQLE